MLKIKNRPFRPRLPEYLKQKVPHGVKFSRVQQTIQRSDLTTVCEEAKCPNRTHCYGRGTLTFQILGNVCTRACGFCAETFGRPKKTVDADEPRKVVEAAQALKLSHVVITSPARDDLPDQGSQLFADTVHQFRRTLPHVTVEILTPDFQDNDDCLKHVFDSRPDIFNHNIETARRLTPKVRSNADYDRSLRVLAKARHAGLLTKSGVMAGHGETRAELTQTFRDLIRAGCRMLTVGQYLAPTAHHLPIQKFYTPAEFDELREEALQYGFLDVASGPLVRSSYHADRTIDRISSFLRQRRLSRESGNITLMRSSTFTKDDDATRTKNSC